MFLPNFDVICCLLLIRRMATWNQSVEYSKHNITLIKYLLCARWSPKILQVDRTRSLLKARVQADEQESVRLLTRKSKRLFSGGGSGIGSFSSHCSTRFCKSCFHNASYEYEIIQSLLLKNRKEKKRYFVSLLLILLSSFYLSIVSAKLDIMAGDHSKLNELFYEDPLL